jgi:hypothetical protein
VAQAQEFKSRLTKRCTRPPNRSIKWYNQPAAGELSRCAIESIMEWFVLKKPKLWGDYGNVLIGGYYRREDDGPLQLHRAGPFLPPLSMPWSSVAGPRVIVSDDFRNDLIDADFNELEF